MEVLYCNDFSYVHKSENFKKTGSLCLLEATKVGFLKFYFALDSDRSSPMVQRRPMITTTTTTTMTKTTKITTTVAMTTRKTLPIILNVALCKVLFL